MATASTVAPQQQVADTGVDRVDLVTMVGNDSKVYAKWTDENVWHSLGGNVASAPQVVPTVRGVIFLVLGTDAKVYARTWESGWTQIPGRFSGCKDLSAAYGNNGDDAARVACAGQYDGQVWDGLVQIQPGGGVAAISPGGARSGVDAWHAILANDIGAASVGVRSADLGSSLLATNNSTYGNTYWNHATGYSSEWSVYSNDGCGTDIVEAASALVRDCVALDTKALIVRHEPSGTPAAVVPGSQIVGQPGVAVDPDDVARHYAIGTDGRLYVATQDADGTMHPFADAGGSGKYGVSAVSYASTGGTRAPVPTKNGGNQATAMTGNDGQVYAATGMFWQGSVPWQSLGGSVSTAPVIVPARYGPMLFVRGNDGAVYARTYEQGWRAVSPAGTNCTDLAVDYYSLSVDCRGTDHRVYTAQAQDLQPVDGGNARVLATGPWQQVGGDVRALAVGNDGEVRHLALGQDGKIYVSPGYGTAGWELFADVQCTSGLATTPDMDAMTCVGPDGALVTLDQSSPEPQVATGSNILGEPAVSTDDNGNTSYWALGQDGRLYRAVHTPDGTYPNGTSPDFQGTAGYGKGGVSVIAFE